MAGAGGFGAGNLGGGSEGIAKAAAGAGDAAKGQTAAQKAAQTGKGGGKSGANKSTKATSADADSLRPGKLAEHLSIDDDKNPDEKKKDSAGSKLGKNALKSAATASALPAMQLASLLAFFKFLKFLFAQAMALLANLWSMIVAAVVNAVKAVVGFVVGVGQTIAGFVGGVVSATVAGVSTAVVTVVAVAGGAVTYAAYNNAEVARHDAIEQCDVNVDAAMASIDVDEGDISEQQLATAAQIYGVMSSIGLSDEHIAGMLGNADTESGIDPTKIESIYGESYIHGPKGQQAEKDDFLRTKVAPDYPYTAVKRMGIGLWQWTDTSDGTATSNTVLRDFAKANNKAWYDLQTQMAFMLSPLDEHNADFEKFRNETFSDPVEAGQYFRIHWERNTALGGETTASNSAKWYPLLGNFEKNDALANSVLALANTTIDDAGKSQVASELSRCIGATAIADNSSLANAMVSFSWPTVDEGRGVNGTYLYVWLHDQIWGPNPTHYADCGFSVSTAVRWSGSDDNYPHSDVAAQLAYVSGEGGGKWQQVSEWNGDMSVLQPGDIFYAVGVPGLANHTAMYVGEDTVVAIKGDKAVLGASDIAHGSLNEFSPGMAPLYNDLSRFVVYRLMSPDNSSLYRLDPPASAKADEGCTTCAFKQNR